MKNDLLKDLSTLTCTKEYTFDYLKDLSISDICQCVLESKYDGNVSEIDIGIGVLTISILDDELSFYFAPSDDLEKELLETLIKDNSKLRDKVESRISSKMIKLYKELV